MSSSFVFLRVRGIPIGAHWTWLFVFVLVIWSLTESLFPNTYPGLEDRAYLAMGVVAGLLFFASILLHELGHAVAALREGMKIEGITLWLLGGVARFSGSFPSPGSEFRIAAAGPLVSIALALVFWLVKGAGDALGAPESVIGVADYLARINGLVVGFNLVPALPLDGGRILRSWLWRRQGNFVAATRSAVRAGMAFGALIAGIGLLDFLSGGGGAGGLWFVFLGWFIIQAAQGEASYATMQQLLSGRRVREFMTPDPDVVNANESIAQFLDEALSPRVHSVYPVVEDGRLAGMVSLRRAGSVPMEERPLKSVADMMMPVHQLRTLSPDTEMVEALDVLQEDPKRAPVVDDGAVVGIISLNDAMRAIEIENIKSPAGARPARSSGILVWLIVGALILGAAGYLYHPPVVVLKPGITLDVTDDISMSGIETTEVSGEYLLTSVRLVQPNALSMLWSMVFTDEELMAASDVIPEGVDEREYFDQQREIFRQSEIISAAAAARAVGMEVSVNGSGAVVTDVLPGAPAARILESGDVIVAVDGRRVGLATELQRAIRSRPAGTQFRLTVERGSRELERSVRSERLSGAAQGNVGLGVFISTRNFDVELPFEIEFRERQIGGPSAGLIYALAITDMLDDTDFSDGRSIAATGTIDLDGSVGPVGGVSAKTTAVDDAGADIFLVPEREVDQVETDALQVTGVSDLDEALDALAEGAAAIGPLFSNQELVA